MTVALARRTLLHAWPRFLPAVLAVAGAGVLILVQAGLILGIFAGASVAVTTSRADLWVGFPGTQSVELGRELPAAVEMSLRMDPAIQRVEPVRLVDGDWRGAGTVGGNSVTLVGIDAGASGLMFAGLVEPGQRALLAEPGTVLVDPADLGKLGVAIGERGEFNGHRLKVIGTVAGLRTLGGVQLVASTGTARGVSDAGPSYFALGVNRGVDVQTVATRLSQRETAGRFEVWTAADFARRSIRYWLFDTGAGLGFVFAGGLVLLVGALIASQTLIAAVSSLAFEYATLRALGVGVSSLRRVVLAQSAWIGVVAIPLGVAASLGVLAVAHSQRVPVYLDLSGLAACVVLMAAVALTSGLLAARAMARIEPASLLR